MVEIDAGTKNIFRQVDHIQLADIHHQAHGYFGLTGIGNFVNVLPNSLLVSALLNLSTSAQELQHFYHRLRSDMINKSIWGSISNTYIKKLRLH